MKLLFLDFIYILSCAFVLASAVRLATTPDYSPESKAAMITMLVSAVMVALCRWLLKNP